MKVGITIASTSWDYYLHNINDYVAFKLISNGYLHIPLMLWLIKKNYDDYVCWVLIIVILT